jgi:hypothetical protein
LFQLTVQLILLIAIDFSLVILKLLTTNYTALGLVIAGLIVLVR